MNFNNILNGYESINSQVDNNFIFDINKLLDNLLSDLYTVVSNKNILKYKFDKITKLNIDNTFESIGDILTNRFNFNIKLKYKETDSVIYSVYPDYSYTNVINAVNDFKKMYPDKNNLLFNITKDSLTKQAIESMDVLRTSISKDLLSIDMKKAKIYGMESTVMYIFIDIKHIIDKSLSSSEIVSLLLKEIGLFFKDIFNINKTYDNNLSLLDSISKINPNDIHCDKLKISLSKYVKEPIEGDNVISVINDFNIRYKKDLDTVVNNNDKSELDFVSMFNMGDTLVAAMVKLKTIKHYREFKSILGDSFKLVLLITLMLVTMFTLLIINVFIGLGALIILSANAILLFLSILFKSVLNVITLVFNKNGNEVTDVLTLIKEITHIKRNLTYSLRDKDIDKKSVELQIDNINKILDNLNSAYRFTNNVSMKDELYKDSNTLIENLNGNDLHYLAETLKDK
jgi:hypothetical protein